MSLFLVDYFLMYIIPRSLPLMIMRNNYACMFFLGFFYIYIYRVVEFTSYSEMKTAIEKLDGTELNGRRIRLIEDKRKSRRSYSSSSRSRSRFQIQSQ